MICFRLYPWIMQFSIKRLGIQVNDLCPDIPGRPHQLNAAIRRIRFRLELPRKVASTIMVTSFGSSTKNIDNAIG